MLQAPTWAARKAIEASGIDPNCIGIICNTSVWRDYLEPGMAVCIHHELGLPGGRTLCVCFSAGGFPHRCNTGNTSQLRFVGTSWSSPVCDGATMQCVECAESGL
jgi:hypothetical protein